MMVRLPFAEPSFSALMPDVIEPAAMTLPVTAIIRSPPLLFFAKIPLPLVVEPVDATLPVALIIKVPLPLLVACTPSLPPVTLCAMMVRLPFAALSFSALMPDVIEPAAMTLPVTAIIRSPSVLFFA